MLFIRKNYLMNEVLDHIDILQHLHKIYILFTYVFDRKSRKTFRNCI